MVKLHNIKSWAVTAAPNTEPVTSAEVKLWAKIDTAADDALITNIIQAARENAENFLNYKLISQTVAEYFTEFPESRGELLLRFPLVSSITSVAYVDTDGANQTFTSYNADLSGLPARLWPNTQTEWPGTKEQLKAVTVTYVCGYANAAAVPQAIKTAILLTIAKWYDNREDSVRMLPTAAERLLEPYRMKLY
ncbi:MAG: phage head-tail connector protein [Saprospiraceae bacterium]|nr:phage head-tail connector protein [Saprospiraceae bacterium]